MTDLATSSELYAEALHGSAVRLRYGNGRCVSLGMSRWLGVARGADLPLLDRAVGPVLDIGCGPGRLVSALALRGVAALGIDLDPAAVRLARQTGAAVLQRSVFDPLPGEGRWGSVLLADGNIGIGGDPARLLRRAAALVRPGGRVVMELSPPGGAQGCVLVRLETPGGRLGEWFPWARVPSDTVEALCEVTGLRLAESWTSLDVGGRRRRWFAVVLRPSPSLVSGYRPREGVDAVPGMNAAAS